MRHGSDGNGNLEQIEGNCIFRLICGAVAGLARRMRKPLPLLDENKFHLMDEVAPSAATSTLHMLLFVRSG